jgi:serine/threonine protein kinase
MNLDTNFEIGSIIGFAGAIVSSKPQFESLHIFDFDSNENDHKAVFRLARVLGALRNAITSLDEEYQQLPKPSLRLPDPSYPFRNYFIDHDNIKVEFEYQKRLHREKLLFRVSRREADGNLLIKFTQRYSKDAHEHCAVHGIAPKLHAMEELDGGWMMVVMEFLNEETYSLLRDSHIPRHVLYPGVKTAISLLHQSDFVHGDIRDVNIMVKREWDENEAAKNVKLIDFDWAGREGIARYPPNVNHTQIERPEAARGGLFITKGHDDFMVDHLFPRSTIGL